MNTGDPNDPKNDDPEHKTLNESVDARRDTVDLAGTADQSSVSRPVSKLPKAAVGRLSLYFRELHHRLESGKQSINSQQLGLMVDVSPAVVRRDLSMLGTIGQRGVGYSVSTLIQRIGEVLGSGSQWRVVLIGVGSLGDALLRYRGFERLGFKLVAAYDNDPQKTGGSIGGVPVCHLDQLQTDIEGQCPDLAIIAVPASAADAVASQLCAAGVSGILNFAPTTIRLPSTVAVVNVDLASELQRLAFAVHSNR